jgi:YbbR domain-containing protein
MFFSFPTEKIIEKEQRQMFLRRIFRRVFLEDWGTKLIALGITFALWLGITGLRAPTSVRLKNVTLNTRISNEMEITNTPPSDVEIVITGDKRIIDRLNARDLVVSIDLADINAGDRIVQLTPETVNLELPSGVKLDNIQPSKFAVKLEKVEEKEVDVKVETEGNVAEGFEVYGTSVLPAKVRVRGAESFVKSMDSISTEKINIEGLKENFFARQVGLNVVNPKVTLLDTIVDINLRIGEKRAERIFVVPFKTETETRNVTVVILGGRSIVEKMQTEDLKIEIIKDEKGVETPQVNLPEELQDKIEIIKKKINP